MSRKINPDEIAYWYDPYKLKAMFLWNMQESYAEPCARILHVAVSTAKLKINKTGLSHEDTIALAKALHMSYEQYREIFLKDVFEDENQ